MKGDRGIWHEAGWGREAWEQREAGGTNVNEQHLSNTPVSSPTEGLRKDEE